MKVSMRDTVEELRWEIPPEWLRYFEKQPRIVIKWRPDGLWPIDPGILFQDQFREMLGSEEFQKNFEVVIMARR